MKQETFEEAKCVNGCKHYYGGEIRHHKDCFYYPESFSKMYDDLERQQEGSYSEEEVLKAQKAILCNIKDALMNENYIIEYIEQFKKK